MSTTTRPQFGPSEIENVKLTHGTLSAMLQAGYFALAEDVTIMEDPVQPAVIQVAYDGEIIAEIGPGLVEIVGNWAGKQVGHETWMQRVMRDNGIPVTPDYRPLAAGLAEMIAAGVNPIAVMKNARILCAEILSDNAPAYQSHAEALRGPRRMFVA